MVAGAVGGVLDRDARGGEFVADRIGGREVLLGLRLDPLLRESGHEGIEGGRGRGVRVRTAPHLGAGVDAEDVEHELHLGDDPGQARLVLTGVEELRPLGDPGEDDGQCPGHAEVVVEGERELLGHVDASVRVGGVDVRQRGSLVAEGLAGPVEEVREPLERGSLALHCLG